MAIDSKSDLTVRLLARSLRQRLVARNGFNSYVLDIANRMSDEELIAAHDNFCVQKTTRVPALA